MSDPVFGVWFGEAREASALQTLDAVGGAPLLTVSSKPIYTALPLVALSALETVTGDSILTASQESILVLARGAAPPTYWETAATPFDGPLPFVVRYESEPWQPAAQVGECVFASLVLTVSWAAAAIVRVEAWADERRAPVTLADGSVVENMPVTFLLDQSVSPRLQRQYRVVQVPLVRRRLLGEQEVARWHLRGQRMQFVVSTVGSLGAGELYLDGAAVEFAPVRRAEHAAVTVGMGALT